MKNNIFSLIILLMTIGCTIQSTYRPYDPTVSFDRIDYHDLHPRIVKELGNLNVVIYRVITTDEIESKYQDCCREGVLSTYGNFLIIYGAFQNYSLNDIELVPYIRVSDSDGNVVRQIDYDGFCQRPQAFDLLFEHKSSIYLPREFQPLRNGRLLKGGVRFWGAIFDLPNLSRGIKLHVTNLGNLSGLFGQTIDLSFIL